MSADRINRIGLLLKRLGIIALMARPDMKAAEVYDDNLPDVPNAIVFPEAAVINLVPAHVGLGPVTFPVGGVEAAFDHQWADVIDAIPEHFALGKLQLEIHAMPVPRLIVIKTNPGSRRKQLIAHVDKQLT